jgi:hypothetical protein
MALSVVCLVTGLACVAPAAGLSDEEVKQGFVSIFNGKDLTGWVIEAKPVKGVLGKAFTARGGELRGIPPHDCPTWLRSEKTYENFILRFDYKIPYYCESGLVIHSPLHGPLSRVGIKIVLTEDTARGAKTQHTGAILAISPAKKVVAKKHSTWYPMEVHMDYPLLRVKVGGEVVQEIDCQKDSKLRYRLRQGYIGFTSHGSPVSFRNIRIKELPAKEEKWIHLLSNIKGIDSKEKWVELKPGGDLGGWNILGKVNWWVCDGMLRARGNGYLITDGEWQDFELFTYIRATPHANGGIFFRWKGLDTRDRAYEIQIENRPDGNNPTGSVYSYFRNENLRAPDNEWFPLQMFVKGSKVFTRVNGDDAVCTGKCTEFVRKGRIVLQMHRHDSQIEWKDLRIKPLDK